MKSKKQNKNRSYLLDTSIQIERCKYTRLNDILECRRNKGDKLVSSFFVLYEFKTGLLKSAIDFYFLVKTCQDVSVAIAKWSENFSVREIKNREIVDSVMVRINESINGKDIQDYLNKLRAVIFNLETNFYTFLDHMVGDFENDIIIKKSIRNEKEYEDFIRVYNERKCIPLDLFWIRNKKELVFLLADSDFKKGYSKMHGYLQDIYNDINNAKKVHHNKGIGDAIICVDCGKRGTIMTLDNSFSILCPILEKKVELLEKGSF